jgi:hypothetical protein
LGPGAAPAQEDEDDDSDGDEGNAACDQHFVSISRTHWSFSGAGRFAVCRFALTEPGAHRARSSIQLNSSS